MILSGFFVLVLGFPYFCEKDRNMTFNWRKLNRSLHRDLGFFFFGMTLIYALSGIAINHMKDWNPNYIISNYSVDLGTTLHKEEINKQKVLALLENLDEKGNYKKYYFPAQDRLKVFMKNGSMVVDMNTGKGYIEKLERRPLFFQLNFLHYNPVKWWTWFADGFAVSLVVLAISGLFMTRGKKGARGRGGIYLAIGMAIPLVFLFLYL